MKRKALSVNWLIPLLGIALAGGGYGATKAYWGYEQTTHAGNRLMATMSRLEDYDEMNRILMQMRSGDAATAARNLDRLLSARILNVNAGLPTADRRTHAVAQIVFSHMAGVRTRYAAKATALPAEPTDDGVAAQKILTQAQAVAPVGK